MYTTLFYFILLRHFTTFCRIKKKKKQNNNWPDSLVTQPPGITLVQTFLVGGLQLLGAGDDCPNALACLLSLYKGQGVPAGDGSIVEHQTWEKRRREGKTCSYSVFFFPLCFFLLVHSSFVSFCLFLMQIMVILCCGTVWKRGGSLRLFMFNCGGWCKNLPRGVFIQLLKWTG